VVNSAGFNDRGWLDVGESPNGDAPHYRTLPSPRR
jgi:hypothetical protein